MKAVTWQGRRSLSVIDVPDPAIEEPTDVIVRITSTAICGSDLHLYEVLGPYMHPGDVIGHEPMGVVEEVGSGVQRLRTGDRVVVPFNVSCGGCHMCRRGLQSQCETTQVSDQGTGAALFGYSSLYGSVPGAQAQYLRVPFGDYGPVRIDSDLPDERYLFLSDILPTAWQAVEYAQASPGGTLAVLGLGPVGQFAARIGVLRGLRVVGVDPVPERRAMAEEHGVETFDYSPDLIGEIRERTHGRGPDSVVDAVGMEAHGSPVASFLHRAVALLPDQAARAAAEFAGVDRLAALHTAVELVRRGGTVSLSGVYGGQADPMPLRAMFDKQVQLRMGQCNVRRWTDALLPFVQDDADPLGVMHLVTHRGSLDEAPALYEKFQKKQDGCIKVVLQP